MTASATLSAQQGLAYVVATHGVLQRQSERTKCPVAQLQTLLALHVLNETALLPSATTSQLRKVMKISLPLLRGYVRELIARKYVERVRFYRRGALLLKLTAEGQGLVTACRRELRGAATRVLDWSFLD